MSDHHATAQRAHVATLARKARGSTHGADFVRALAQVCDAAAAYSLGLTTGPTSESLAGDVGEPCERVIVADGRNAWRVRIAIALCDAHGCACELREIGSSRHPSFVVYGPPRAVALVDDLASVIGLEISRASSVLRRQCPGEGGEDWRRCVAGSLAKRIKSQAAIVDDARLSAATPCARARVRRAHDYLARAGASMR